MVRAWAHGLRVRVGFLVKGIYVGCRPNHSLGQGMYRKQPITVSLTSITKKRVDAYDVPS